MTITTSASSLPVRSAAGGVILEAVPANLGMAVEQRCVRTLAQADQMPNVMMVSSALTSQTRK